MVTEEELDRIALALPGAVKAGNKYEIADKGFAWAYQQKVDGRRGRVERRDVLAVRVSNLDEKDALIAADPEKFFTDAHYSGFPAVLVRLAAIEAEELGELLHDAWRTRAPCRRAAVQRNSRITQPMITTIEEANRDPPALHKNRHRRT